MRIHSNFFAVLRSVQRSFSVEKQCNFFGALQYAALRNIYIYRYIKLHFENC